VFDHAFLYVMIVLFVYLAFDVCNFSLVLPYAERFVVACLLHLQGLSLLVGITVTNREVLSMCRECRSGESKAINYAGGGR